MTESQTESKTSGKKERAEEGQFSPTVLETLKMAYRPARGRIAFTLVLGLMGRLLLLGNANVIGLWVDSFCRAPQKCRPLPAFVQGWTAEKYILVLLLMTGIGFLMTLFFRVLFSRLSARAVSQIYDEVTWRTSRFPLSFFDTIPAGRVITRFSSDYGSVFRLFGGPLAEFISIVFDLIAMIFLIAVASLWYLIPVAVAVALNSWLFRRNQEPLRKARRELSASRSPSIAHFAETAQGASTIRVFSREKIFEDRFRNLDHYFLKNKEKTLFRIVMFSFQMNTLSGLFFLFTGLAATVMVNQGFLSIGSVGVAFGFIVLSGNAVQMFFEWLSQFEEALIGVERMDRYLRSPLEEGNRLPATATFETGHPKATEDDEKKQKKLLITERRASVHVKNLWFRYSPQLPWVLKELNFNVAPGEKLGVIGRTGSGKSSLIQALFYLYPLDRGEISINDLKPQLSSGGSGVDLQRYRHLISYISQDPTLFQGKLRDNLDMTHQHSDSKIWQALEKVGLREWIQSLPQGLDFRIEEKGKNLSLGEKQLLCMARVLLTDAPVVIMDEATSSVDPQSEEILVKATREFFADRTQILVAHRLSTLQNCDRILWLHQGEVRALGPTLEVLSQFESASLRDSSSTL